MSVSFITGVPFPKNFQQVCKKILSRLFRVFVHVYIHHFDSICSMGAEAHINTCYKHYYYFISEFNLIDHSELEPLVRVGFDLRCRKNDAILNAYFYMICAHTAAFSKMQLFLYSQFGFVTFSVIK